MNRVIRCECGFEAVGDVDDQLLQQAQAHARELHGIDVSAKSLLSLMRTLPAATGQAKTHERQG